MHDPADMTWDVAAIGLGPVGATFASLLSLLGLRTVVLELDAKVNPSPSAVAVDDEATGSSDRPMHAAQLEMPKKLRDRAVLRRRSSR